MAIDYKSFSDSGPSKDLTPASKRWWLLPKSERPDAIASVVKSLFSQQTARFTQNVVSARLYGNLPVLGTNGLSFTRMASAIPGLRERISWNVVQSCVDTVTSKIAKNKPRPLFLTSGGDYRIQRKAKKLTKFTDGIFYQNRAYEMGKNAFRDGAVWGTGVIHVFRRHNRVMWERVLPEELLVDEIEALYVNPTQIHRVKAIDRDILKEAFPESRKQIEGLDIVNFRSGINTGAVSDVVEVRESYHLPSGPDADDGLHAITIDGHEILSEKWERPYFPFAFFHWNKRLFGFFGQGGVEQIQSIQVEINKILWIMQRSHHLAGTFKIAVENTAKITKSFFNNEIGTIIPFTTTPPAYLLPPIVQPELYEHLMRLTAQAFQQFGISQLSAQSKKPDGLDSGKALREFNDIESDRFMTVGQAYEQFYLDLARLSIDEAKAIAKETGNYKVAVPGSKFLETIEWNKVSLDESQYEMKCYPTSSLPQDPAGRLQTIQEYIQAGFLSPRSGRRLLGFPDLEQIETLANAQEEYIHKVFEGILDAKDLEEANTAYVPPEPFDDMVLAEELAIQYYTDGKMNGVEEYKLDLMRQFLDQLEVLKTKAQTPPEGALPPDGGMPLANPEPLPVSDLVPQVA
jgi:hypothetical protein